VKSLTWWKIDDYAPLYIGRSKMSILAIMEG